MNNADVAAPVFSMGKEGKGKQDIQKTYKKTSTTSNDLSNLIESCDRIGKIPRKDRDMALVGPGSYSVDVKHNKPR